MVLHVSPSTQDGKRDPELLDALPPGIATTSSECWPRWMTSWAGIRSISIRGYRQFGNLGAKAIQSFRPDIVYFTTTQFTLMNHVPKWKRRFQVPMVGDIQDPWIKEHPVPRVGMYSSLKYRVTELLSARNEPRTMAAFDHLTVVSPEYKRLYAQRYPHLEYGGITVLPFGAGEADFEWIKQRDRGSSSAHDGKTWLFAGRLGPVMERSLRALVGGLAAARLKEPETYGRIRLRFIGTDYSPLAQPDKGLGRVVQEYGASGWVTEEPGRVPYFDALRAMSSAARVLILGSDDPAYVPSKMHQCFCSGSPVLAVCMERSSAFEMLRDAGVESVIPLGDAGERDAERALEVLLKLGCMRSHASPEFTVEHSSLRMVERLVDVFESVLKRAPKS